MLSGGEGGTKPKEEVGKVRGGNKKSKENNINKIGFSLATLATAPKTFDFPTFFCCWGVAAVAGNVTPKSCVAGILMGTYENQKQ